MQCEHGQILLRGFLHYRAVAKLLSIQFSHEGSFFFVLFWMYHHSPGHQESQRGPKRALIQVPIASLVGS